MDGARAGAAGSEEPMAMIQGKEGALRAVVRSADGDASVSVYGIPYVLVHRIPQRDLLCEHDQAWLRDPVGGPQV